LEATVRSLGDLEATIMRSLWRRQDPATVRDVHDELAADREIAYTTVMTVMDRLWRKGLLQRTAAGRAFAYRPALDEAEYTARLMQQLLHTATDRRGALAHFVKGMHEADEAELLRLAKEAARRKRSV